MILTYFWGHVLLLGLNGLFLGSGYTSRTVLGSTHVVEQLLFSTVPSIQTFDFDLILGSFFTFWGTNGLFLGLVWGSKTVLGSTHVVEQLSFSMFLSILSFDFDLILGSFLLLGSLMGYFWVGQVFKTCFGVYS